MLHVDDELDVLQNIEDQSRTWEIKRDDGNYLCSYNDKVIIVRRMPKTEHVKDAVSF